MFSWFRRPRPAPNAPPPPVHPPPPPRVPLTTGHAKPPDVTLPNLGTKLRVAFTSQRRSWEEDFDLLDVTAHVLRWLGHTVSPGAPGVLRIDPAGLMLRPSLQHFQPLDDGAGSDSVSTIHVAHPAFGPGEVFEFQHSTGQTLEQALRAGVEQWARVDLPVFLDALAPKPAHCMLMQMGFPAKDDAPARARRAVLGPVAHFASQPPAAPAGDNSDEHPFCPCCFFTNTFDAFKPQLESDGFYAIRFYAARDPAGNPQADCRINGQDHPDGAAALRDYVTKWPQAGVEFRKQYVILQNDAWPADGT
jgi:hypothetical protein